MDFPKLVKLLHGNITDGIARLQRKFLVVERDSLRQKCLKYKLFIAIRTRQSKLLDMKCEDRIREPDKRCKIQGKQKGDWNENK